MIYFTIFLFRFNCDCKGFSREDFCKCDRFDQATLNVLVHDYYDYRRVHIRSGSDTDYFNSN